MMRVDGHKGFYAYWTPQREILHIDMLHSQPGKWACHQIKQYYFIIQGFTPLRPVKHYCTTRCANRNANAIYSKANAHPSKPCVAINREDIHAGKIPSRRNRPPPNFFGSRKFMTRAAPHVSKMLFLSFRHWRTSPSW